MRKMYRVFKRVFDLNAALFGLLIFSPLLVIVIFLIWLQDFKSPFYISNRVGKNEKNFKIIKLRSMVVEADKQEVDSTPANDSRITPVGHFIRKYKLDELSQLWNVLKGDMSLVGPRPNVKRETNIYTIEEKKLLTVRPGITDFASIVFADEGDILFNSFNPDISYNQLIRPGKSELGLFYISVQSFFLDISILFTTIISIFSRKVSLKITSYTIKKYGGKKDLIILASRKNILIPTPPPGALSIVTNRNLKNTTD
jgi:lipopolysaccharide/colanic/teichoic acid biosynthesis glycosyltransferase